VAMAMAAIVVTALKWRNKNMAKNNGNNRNGGHDVRNRKNDGMETMVMSVGIGLLLLTLLLILMSVILLLC